MNIKLPFDIGQEVWALLRVKGSNPAEYYIIRTEVIEYNDIGMDKTSSYITYDITIYDVVDRCNRRYNYMMVGSTFFTTMEDALQYALDHDYEVTFIKSI